LAVSPGVNERGEFLRHLVQGELQEIKAAIEASGSSPVTLPAKRLLSLFPHAAAKVDGPLRHAANFEVPLQPCIRDVWHDHILFTGDQLSGIVDFGAMRRENVAADLARLLGSLVGDDQENRAIGLAAYADIRPLSAAEETLVDVYDKSTVLLSGMNWLRWIFLEGRRFDRLKIIANRLEAIAVRLERLAQSRS
jgi:homoserine kinase type II